MNYLTLLSILLFFCTSSFAQKKSYPLSEEPIDIIFVCHPKDTRTLDLAIAGIKKNGKNIRNIFVISAKKLTENAEWFDEGLYPFNKATLALEIFHGNQARATEYLQSPKSRIGWIYQQLLKLYASFIIPGISSNILVVDADTIFLNSTEFINKQGHALFNPTTQYHAPYFEHGARLLPGFKKIYPNYSGVAHHMLFQRPILEDLFKEIEEAHATQPWKALCRCIDPQELFKSPLSEYEIYFNFAFERTEQVEIRRLTWKEIPLNKEKIKKYRRDGYHYVSCHSYIK